LAVSGYKESVDWNISVAFDLMFLSELQDNSFRSVSGPKSVHKRLKNLAPGLVKELGFRMVFKSA
jgi:hypothetical protein